MNSFVVVCRYLAIYLYLIVALASPFSHSTVHSNLLAYMFFWASMLSLAEVIIDEQRGAASFMYEFFISFFVAIPAVIQTSSQLYPWFTLLPPTYVSLTFGLFAISQIFYKLGGSYRWVRLASNDHSSLLYSSLHARHFTYYSRASLVIVVAALLFAFAAGVDNLFTARFERSVLSYAGMTQQFLFVSRSFILVAFLLNLALFKAATSSAQKRLIGLRILLLGSSLLIINYPPALPRFFLFGIILSISIILLNFFHRKTKLLMIALSVPVLLFIFPAIKLLGGGSVELANIINRFNPAAIFGYLISVEFDSFMQSASALIFLYEEEGSIRYGLNFLGAILFFVPAALWPSKPSPSGDLVASSLGYSFTNVSSPLPAEALLGIGLLGPAIIMFLFGWMVREIEGRCQAGVSQSSVLSCVTHAVLGGFMIIIMRGSLNAVFAQFGATFFVIMCLAYMRKVRVTIS